MTPALHQKVAVASMVGCALAAVVYGIVHWSWGGLFLVVPGLLLGAIVHKLIVENLPVRCAECGGKMTIETFTFGQAEVTPERQSLDTSSELTQYRCLTAGHKVQSRFF